MSNPHLAGTGGLNGITCSWSTRECVVRGNRSVLLSFGFEYLIRMGEDGSNMLAKAHSRLVKKPLWIDRGRWHRYVSMAT